MIFFMLWMRSWKPKACCLVEMVAHTERPANMKVPCVLRMIVLKFITVGGLAGDARAQLKFVQSDGGELLPDLEHTIHTAPTSLLDGSSIHTCLDLQKGLPARSRTRFLPNRRG
jgi:hypothetical protein